MGFGILSCPTQGGSETSNCLSEQLNCYDQIGVPSEERADSHREQKHSTFWTDPDHGRVDHL